MTLTVACMASESRPRYVAALQGERSIELVLCDDEAATIAALPRCNVLVMGGSQYTPAIADALLRGGHRIEWIQLASTGVDNLARFGVPRGVVVTNAAAAVAPAVAEHAIALMLAAKRQIVVIDRTRREPLPRSTFVPGLSSVNGETLLIVGYGAIGREIARRASALDMHVIATTRRPDAAVEPGVSLHSLDELDVLLPRADVVVLALALTPQTQRLFGAARLGRMRRSAWLINVARGALVDEDALIVALRDGRIAGAALDVTEVEPAPADSALRTMPNVILTPHLAGFGSEATKVGLARIVVDNLRRRVEGRPLENVVDPVNYGR